MSNYQQRGPGASPNLRNQVVPNPNGVWPTD